MALTSSFSTLQLRPQNRRSFFPSKLTLKSPLQHFSSNNSSTQSLHAQPTISLGRTPPLSRQPSAMSLNNVTSHSDTPDLNTLPDPRAASPQMSRQSSAGSDHHPDLNSEVAALSAKLVNALNYQTDLDDSLQSTRHELEAARELITQLEKQTQEHAALLSQGFLVKKDDAMKAQEELRQEIEQERLKRNNAEQAKKSIELELEALTGQLFQEANTMVASARREKEESEQKNEQLRAQLQEAEVLLASHQAQLKELKAVLHNFHRDTPGQKEAAHTGSAPTTPTNSTAIDRNFTDTPISPTASSDAPPFLSPENPLHYSHLVQPIMRTDIQAYDEFLYLLKSSAGAASTPSSRVQSGSFAGLNVMGLAGLNQSASKVMPSTSAAAPSAAAAAPVSSLAASASPGPPSIPGSFQPTTPPEQALWTTSKDTSLKDSKFYKRTVLEDVEPALRLDLAPGLSWLARRSVLNSLVAGTLIVDPYPVNSRYWSPAFPCALCGEYRKQPAYLRTHRFRTSDSEDAQRYPTCDFCLARLRATADFIAFLRHVKNGHWKAESEDDERQAWEECTRLREKMFWTRLGGGVVPVTSAPPSELAQTPQSVRAFESNDSHDQHGGTSQLEKPSHSTALGSPISRRPKSIVVDTTEAAKSLDIEAVRGQEPVVATESLPLDTVPANSASGEPTVSSQPKPDNDSSDVQAELKTEASAEAHSLNA